MIGMVTSLSLRLILQVVSIDPAGRVNVSDLATSLDGALLSEENKANGMYTTLCISMTIMLNCCCSSSSSSSQIVQDRN